MKTGFDNESFDRLFNRAFKYPFDYLISENQHLGRHIGLKWSKINDRALRESEREPGVIQTISSLRSYNDVRKIIQSAQSNSETRHLMWKLYQGRPVDNPVVCVNVPDVTGYGVLLDTDDESHPFLSSSFAVVFEPTDRIINLKTGKTSPTALNAGIKTIYCVTTDYQNPPMYLDRVYGDNVLMTFLKKERDTTTPFVPTLHQIKIENQIRQTPQSFVDDEPDANSQRESQSGDDWPPR